MRLADAPALRFALRASLRAGASEGPMRDDQTDTSTTTGWGQFKPPLWGQCRLPFSAILVPVIQFLWRLAWQPWNDLRAGVEEIRSQIGEPRPAPEEPQTTIDRRLTVLDFIRRGSRIEESPLDYWAKSERAEQWIDEVTRMLAKHVSQEAAEQFLTISADEKTISERVGKRLEVLRRLVDENLPPS